MVQVQEDGWVKSSLSYANGNCVEVRPLAGGQVELRNSRFPALKLPAFGRAEWEAFIGGVRAGEFDADALTPVPNDFKVSDPGRPELLGQPH
jgi:uncharacterized protein DUF397